MKSYSLITYEWPTKSLPRRTVSIDCDPADYFLTLLATEEARVKSQGRDLCVLINVLPISKAQFNRLRKLHYT